MQCSTQWQYALFIPAYATTETERRNGSDANIYGHVIDSLTGKHIPYVTIAIEGTTMGCVTDATGHYFLKNIPEGRWSVEASSLGYKTVTREINAVAGKSIEINFTLHEDATMVDEVVVSATRNETNRKKTATVVNVMSGKLFESTASSTTVRIDEFPVGAPRRKQLRQLRNDAAAHQRPRRPILADTA